MPCHAFPGEDPSRCKFYSGSIRDDAILQYALQSHAHVHGDLCTSVHLYMYRSKCASSHANESLTTNVNVCKQAKCERALNIKNQLHSMCNPPQHGCHAEIARSACRALELETGSGAVAAPDRRRLGLRLAEHLMRSVHMRLLCCIGSLVQREREREREITML